MAKRKATNVETEVRIPQNRLAGVESVTRMTLHVQLDSLTKAEKLRKLVMAFKVASERGHKEIQAAGRLIAFAETLEPFHNEKLKVSKAVRKFLRERK